MAALGLTALLAMSAGSGAEASTRIKHVGGSVPDVTVVPSGANVVRIYGQWSARHPRCMYGRPLTIRWRSGPGAAPETFGAGTTAGTPPNIATFDVNGSKPNYGSYAIIFASKSFKKRNTLYICKKYTYTVYL